MADPCDKGPVIDMLADSIERIHSELREDAQVTHEKLDQMLDVFREVAVERQRVDTLVGKLEDVESRLRKIEGIPLKFLVWTGSIIASVVAGVTTYLFNS